MHIETSQLPDGAFDCVIIATEHSTFDYDCLQRVAKTVVDTRNAICEPQAHVTRLGARVRELVREFDRSDAFVAVGAVK